MQEGKPNKEITSREQSIYIIGPNALQNEMMAKILQNDTGAICRYFTDIRDIPLNNSEESSGNIIIWDCFGDEARKTISLLESDIYQSLSSMNYLVIFNISPEQGIEERILQLGGRGIFYVTDSYQQLVRGVQAVLKGELWFSREAISQVITNRDKISLKVKELLSEREIEIISLMAVGARNEEISESLFISSNMVKIHISNIFRKTNATNQLQAALWLAKNL